MILIAGLSTLWVGGDFAKKWSNRLMRYRIIAQFIAVVVIMGFLYFVNWALTGSRRNSLAEIARVVLLRGREPCDRPWQRRFTTKSGTRISSSETPGETSVLYIDRHLVHEVTSPQAFEGLRAAGRKVRRPDLTLAVADHNVPTTNRAAGIADPESAQQIATWKPTRANSASNIFPMGDIRQGIVHIVGPEQGWTLPGTTIVCGDSHTSTHGAFGALAFGIGTSEVEHVLATQTLLMNRAKNMRVTVNGKLAASASPRKTWRSPSSRRSEPRAARVM